MSNCWKPSEIWIYVLAISEAKSNKTEFKKIAIKKNVRRKMLHEYENKSRYLFLCWHLELRKKTWAGFHQTWASPLLFSQMKFAMVSTTLREHLNFVYSWALLDAVRPQLVPTHMMGILSNGKSILQPHSSLPLEGFGFLLTQKDKKTFLLVFSLGNYLSSHIVKNVK